MTSGTPVSEDELHAAADGRLPPERQAEVEAFLAANPEAAGRLGFYRRLNAALHASYDFMLGEPVPAGLSVRRRRRFLQMGARAAAALALLLAGGVGGWLLRDISVYEERRMRDFAALAADAHAAYAPEVRHPVEVSGTEREHLQKWLSKRLSGPVQVPDLGPIGYAFVGGRLLPANGGVAGQLMYENAAGNRVTLYFKKAVGEPTSAFRYVVTDGLSVFYWHDAQFNYALTSELAREQLLPICKRVYEQLNPGGGPVEEW
jgi:anti-sigma factor RsiW